MAAARSGLHIPGWIFGLAALAVVYLLVYFVIRRLGARLERWLAARRRRDADR